MTTPGQQLLLRRGRRGLGRFVWAVIAFSTLAGCGVDPQQRNTGVDDNIVVGAASDLRFAFTDLGEKFKEATGITATFTFGSSGQLKEQILNGAPFDVFASANELFVDDVVAADQAWSDTVQPYAFGRIVMVARNGLALPGSLAEIAQDAYVRIAIANPEHAPYGTAARQALETAGVYDAIKSRLVLGSNVSDTLRLVDTGNVDIAIVALSLMMNGTTPFQLIPESDHKQLKQSIVATKTGGNQDGARKFLNFLASDIGREIMESYGFVIPDEVVQ